MEITDSVVARVVFQRCSKAKLKLSVESEDSPEDFAVLNAGLIVYVAFVGEVPAAKLHKLVNIICNTKICESNDKLVSILDLPGDLLLIPHFCLGGRLKGKQFQYHSVVPKCKAEDFFKSLVDGCKEVASSNSAWASSGSRVFAGTYGIRQDLSFESHGPYTHVVEI